MTIWVAAESLGQRGTAGEVVFANPVSDHKLKAWEEEMRAKVGADDENYVKYQDQEVQRENEEEMRKEAKTQDEGHAKRKFEEAWDGREGAGLRRKKNQDT